MEIKTAEQISNSVEYIKEALDEGGYCEKYLGEIENTFYKKWVSVESILDNLEQAIEKGIESKEGFSAAIWISNFKKKISENIEGDEKE